MRDAVARFDCCSYLAVAVFLTMTARLVAHHHPRFASGMAWAGIATLLAVGATGYAEVRPTGTVRTLGVAVIAWICAAAAGLAAAVLLPPLASLRDGWREAAERRKAEADRKRAEEERADRERRESDVALERQRRREEEERLERDRLATLPPAPSRDEMWAEAVAKRDEEVRAAQMIMDELERRSKIEQAERKLSKKYQEIYGERKP